jgi:integrase
LQRLINQRAVTVVEKQHLKAIAEGTRILREETKKEDVELTPFELYTLRHTCLTRWAPHMDPWTLAYLAGHRDMNITKRCVHPQEQTIRTAMEKVQEEKRGHTAGHTGPNTGLAAMSVLTLEI